jgi:hypothetical protein
MSIFVIAALLLLVSCAAGLYTLRSIHKDPAYSRGEKFAAFTAAFIGWPFVLAALLAVLLTCWDVLFLYDRDLDSLGDTPPPNS